jgi:NPCBM/NEW2 domain
MTIGAIVLATIAAAPVVEVSTVDDRVVKGALVAIDGKSVTVQGEGAPARVPLPSVLEVRVAPSEAQPAPAETVITLRLRGGGVLACRDVLFEERTLIADTAVAGKVRLPLAAAEAIRFRLPTDATADEWEELASSEPERDLLVVRNGDVLDRLDGTFGGLDAKTLTFRVGETRVPIDRSKEKLFGVVFGRAPSSSGSSSGDVRFRNGDRLPLSSVVLSGEALQVTLPTGSSVTVPLDGVDSVDFGRGKIQYLSQLEPRGKEHTPYIGTAPLDSVFDVLIDRSDAGPRAPIRIDRQVFKGGLVIHSKTRLTYRLNGEYRRLVAVAGIEQLVRPLGDVDLVIAADGRELLRKNVKGTDAPLPIDLDVSGARELTILVDFAGDWDISDHLALGDARLIK